MDGLISMVAINNVNSIDHFILHEVDMFNSFFNVPDTGLIVLRFPYTALDTVELLDTFISGSGCLMCLLNLVMISKNHLI